MSPTTQLGLSSNIVDRERYAKKIMFSFNNVPVPQAPQQIEELLAHLWRLHIEDTQPKYRAMWRRVLIQILKTYDNKRKSAVVTPAWSDVDFSPVGEALAELDLSHSKSCAIAMASSVPISQHKHVVHNAAKLLHPEMLAAGTRVNDERYAYDSYYFLSHLAKNESVELSPSTRPGAGYHGLHSHYACAQLWQETQVLSRLSQRELSTALTLLGSEIKDGIQLADLAYDLSK